MSDGILSLAVSLVLSVRTAFAIPAAFACAFGVAALWPLQCAAAPGANPFESRSAAELQSVSNVLAGIEPAQSPLAEIAARPNWMKHRDAMQSTWQRVEKRHVQPMKEWRDRSMPPGCPAGRTLLYPFSGPDFFNAYWLFPGCDNFVLFGLEKIGVVPELQGISDTHLNQLLADVRNSIVNLVVRNYFITSRMATRLHTAQLRGVLPIVLIAMARTGNRVERVSHLELAAPVAAPATATRRAKASRATKAITGLMIEFRATDSPRPRRLYYFSLDATDRGISAYPQFVDFLRGLGKTTVLIKSASYLLHGGEFTRVRDVLLQNGRFLVQDDTGIPYARLKRGGWTLKFYGNYVVPIKPFEYAYQAALAREFKAQKAEPLNFLFGYRRHPRDDRSNVMVGSRPDVVIPGATQ